MSAFEEGYAYFAQNVGVSSSALFGKKYVKNVENTIAELATTLNEKFGGNHSDAKQLKGNVAEFYHAGTFNINAAVKSSKSKAVVLESHKFASVDVQVETKKQKVVQKSGIKYYQSPLKTMRQQAKTAEESYREYVAQGRKDSFEEYLKEKEISNPNAPIYSDQIRIVPKEQLEEIKKLLRYKIAAESSSRPEEVERYKETLKMINDRIRDGKGVEGIPLDTESLIKLTKSAKKAGVTSEKLKEMGLSVENLIGFSDVMREAFKAGLSAATISAIMKIAPEIYKALDHLIEIGEIDQEEFRKIGFAALTGTSEGFLRGTVAAALTISCQKGLLGATIKSIDPSIIGAVTAIVMDTMKNSFFVAKEEMSRQELVNSLIRDIFITSSSLSLGTATQYIIKIPVLGYMLGSFIGSLVGSFAYNTSYDALISFCIESGFTIFGLVEQDYELPDEVFESIGAEVFDYEIFDFEKLSLNEFPTEEILLDEPKREELSITVLRRGVIGVSRIGYV